jgi:hypothetical protein
MLGVGVGVCVFVAVTVCVGVTTGLQYVQLEYNATTSSIIVVEDHFLSVM